MFSINKPENPPKDVSADRINEAVDNFNQSSRFYYEARRFRNERLKRLLKGLGNKSSGN